MHTLLVPFPSPMDYLRCPTCALLSMPKRRPFSFVICSMSLQCLVAITNFRDPYTRTCFVSLPPSLRWNSRGWTVAPLPTLSYVFVWCFPPFTFVLSPSTRGFAAHGVSQRSLPCVLGTIFHRDLPRSYRYLVRFGSVWIHTCTARRFVRHQADRAATRSDMAEVETKVRT